jgi:uncharacterized protein
VDLFNILCLPSVTTPAVYADAIAFCNEKRAFCLVDVPSSIDTVDEAVNWIDTAGALKDKNAAAYWPRIQAADPLNNYRVREFPASGAVAGVYARTDASRGVWKAPAGTEARLAGVRSLSVRLTDRENGLLNPLGVNCLRTFPLVGPLVWGARTLAAPDGPDRDWGYVPVRRLASYVEESLQRGLQWAVFEPNDEQLWQQIRLNASGYLHTLFLQGAFKGTTPREAYFVRCDGDTTTDEDIANGVVNVLVGIAPVRPAEFVVVRIQQLAGQFDG